MIRFAVCNELYRDWSCAKAFAHARRCGYEGIEVAPHTLGSQHDRFSPSRSTELLTAASDQGLAIIGLHWLLAETDGLHWASDDPQIRRATADYFMRLIELCETLGGSVMVLGSPKQRSRPPHIRMDQGIEFAADVLETILPQLAASRIVLAIEPLGPEETNFLNTADQAVELIRRLNSPNVRLHLDVKAMTTEAMPIPEIISTHKNDLAHFHANDPNRRGPGMGQVDFVPILRALRNANYDGWVSVEVFDESPGIDVLAGESIRNLQRDYQLACLP